MNDTEPGGMRDGVGTADCVKLVEQRADVELGGVDDWPLPTKEGPSQWPGRTFAQGNDRRSRADQSASDEWEDELRRAH